MAFCGNSHHKRLLVIIDEARLFSCVSRFQIWDLDGSHCAEIRFYRLDDLAAHPLVLNQAGVVACVALGRFLEDFDKDTNHPATCILTTQYHYTTYNATLYVNIILTTQHSSCSSRGTVENRKKPTILHRFACLVGRWLAAAVIAVQVRTNRRERAPALPWFGHFPAGQLSTHSKS